MNYDTNFLLYDINFSLSHSATQYNLTCTEFSLCFHGKYLSFLHFIYISIIIFVLLIFVILKHARDWINKIKGIYYRRNLILLILFFVYSFEEYDSSTQTLTITNLDEYNKREQYQNTAKYVYVDGVEEIENFAFLRWINLQTFEVGDSVIIIGGGVFNSCVLLANVTLSKSVTSIGPNTFSSCIRLKIFKVSDENKYFSTDNGILYNKNYTTIVCYPIGISDTSFSIPNTVITIGGYSFSLCLYLESINVPNSVITIEIQAFYSCKALNNINIPNSVKTIGSNAFYSCPAFSNLIIPDSVVRIESYAFNSCSNLVKLIIGENVEQIGIRAFYSCKSLTHVTIGKSLHSINSDAFLSCSSLQFFEVSTENTYLSNDNNGILFDKYFTLLITCPSGTSVETYDIPDSVTQIGAYAFYECSSFTYIKISDSVTQIESFGFYKCSSLKTIVIGASVNSIGNYGFYYCTDLTCIYFKGYQQPTLGNSYVFDNVPATYVMTSDLYSDAMFGTFDVSIATPIEGCDAYSWPTHTFTMSNSFSNSNTFSKSNSFSQSQTFSFSYSFTNSNTFSNSNSFTQSETFSSSNTYTKSNTFTNSNTFSKSNTFSQSRTFTHSNTFSNSNTFSQSRTFTHSNTLSNSNSFTQSNTFTNSNHFTSSLQFDLTYVKTIIYTGSFIQTIISETHFTNTISVYMFGSLYSYIETILIYYEYKFVAYSTYISYYSGYYTVINQKENESNNQNKNNQTIIIIICVCVVIVIIIIILIILIIRIRNKKRSTEESIAEDMDSKDIAMRNFTNISNIKEDPFAEDFKENKYFSNL